MGYLLGLTGSFGSGKSAVAQIFREDGAYVIDADALARLAVAPGGAALAAVTAEFGAEMLDEQGGVDRRRLAQRVFSDRKALARLNGLIHPHVRREMMRLIEENAAQALIVLDVPLLLEVGMDREVDGVAVVTISERKRFGRLHGRGYSEKEIIARLGMQMAQQRKIGRADFVIDNSGSRERTRKQIQAILDRIQGEKTDTQ